MGKHHRDLECEAYEAIVGMSFEFAILIDIENGLCKILKKQGKKRIPYLVDGDYIPYKVQLESFINYSVSKNSQKEAANKMSLNRIKEETKDGKTYTVFFSVLIPGGKIRFKKWRYARLPSDENKIIFTREDVTDAVLSERDKVTGLVTIERMLVESRLILEKNKGFPFYFIYLDIDGFSNYNQLFGEESGNGLLKHVATFLLGLRSENVVVGHLSSDNFVLLMPKASFKKESFLPLEDVLNAYNHNFSYAISIGLATVNSHIEDIRSVQEQAHIANRSLKNTRGVAFAIYNKALSQSVLINQSIVPLLREGILNHEFVPYYQPIVDSKTGKTVMAEALVRWISPTRGIVSPNDFIPILEKNGFIGELDYYIRDQVCAFIKSRSEEGDSFPISVNISRIELESPSFVDELEKQVTKFGINRSLLRLEITETMVMEKVQQSMKNVKELKKKGFYLEMDDFGSGYSSLSVLRDLPFDLLKLDLRFFIGKHSKKGSAIIKAIASLAHSAGLSIIAEGVEIQAQEDFLKGLGIHYIQGYLHSKPLPEEKLLEFYQEK